LNHVHDHYFVEGDCLQVDKAHEKSKETEHEGAVVARADTLVDESAVVVEVYHATITKLAVG
jgi:hypothetical protein